MNYQSLLAWFAVIMLWSLNTAYAQAQSSTEAVVLIQSVPTRVMVQEDGTITEVIKTERNYMAGYDLRPNNPSSTSIASTTDVRSDANVYSTSNYDLPAYNNILSFKTNDATLSKSTLKELDIVAEKLKGNGRMVNLTVFKHNSQSGISTISVNRLDACKKYLELKGIDITRISNDVQIVGATDKALSKIAFVIK